MKLAGKKLSEIRGNKNLVKLAGIKLDGIENMLKKYCGMFWGML